MANNYNELFDEKKKIEVFDKIAENFFNKNFGSMSKVNLETLLFSEYIETVIEKGEKFDDYTLSRQLGITQNKIRTLKERKELQYPYEKFEWKKGFAECVKYAKYDNEDKYIKMIIEDVNVMNEVRNYIEKNGWFDEASLNKKLLKIRLDCFVFLCVRNVDFDSKFKKEARDNINKLKYKDNALMELIKEFSAEKLKEFILNGGTQKSIALILKNIPAVGVSKVLLDNVANVLEKV